MITAIVIPADPVEPLKKQAIDATDLSVYRSLVGGNLEVARLEKPPASLYCNEEGKGIGLPINPRATVLWWAHNEAVAGRDWIVGDAFLVGPAGSDGADTATPEVYVSLLLEARFYRIEVQTVEDGKWHLLGGLFDSALIAYAAAIELAHHPAVGEVRLSGMA